LHSLPKIMPEEMKDWSWKGISIDPEKNFCRHLATELEKKSGNEKTKVTDCGKVAPEDCADSYEEGETGKFALCENPENNPGACVAGLKHECKWTFFMEDLLKKQDHAEHECFGEMLEAKRSLDGLLHSVNDTYAHLMLYNQIIHENNITIRQKLKEQQEYWVTYIETQEQCMKDALRDWRLHVQPLDEELEELEAIAEPDVRSAVGQKRNPGYENLAKKGFGKEGETTTGLGKERVEGPGGRKDAFAAAAPPKALTGLAETGSLLETGSSMEMSAEMCEQFMKVIEKVESFAEVELPKPVDCHDKRAALKRVFTESFNTIAKLMDKRNQTVFDNRTICLNDATYTYKYLVEGPGGIDDVIQKAAAEIHEAQRRIAELEPQLHDVEHATTRMRKYLKELNKTCELDKDVTKHLAKIRGLIIELEECPGRNDFTLTLPPHVHPDATTPSPTPWQDRYPGSIQK